MLTEETLAALTDGRVSRRDAELFRVTLKISKSDDGGSQVPREILERYVLNLGLSERAVHSLVSKGIHTLADLLQLDEQRLLTFPDFDRARVAEVQAMLARFGLKLPLTRAGSHSP